MAKIETYILATQPLSFSDMLIGTEVNGPIPNATKNFSLGELYNLFATLPIVGNLQQTLNAGNTATQNILLNGGITSTTIKPEYIIDILSSTGAVGEVLIRAVSGISWGPIPSPTIPNLQQVTDVIPDGNKTTNNIIVGNFADYTDLSTSGVIITHTPSLGNYGFLTSQYVNGTIRFAYTDDYGSSIYADTYIRPLIDGTYNHTNNISLPDASGILAISVNGNTADNFGNITITTGGGTNPTDTYIPYNNAGTFDDSYLVNDTASSILKTRYAGTDIGLYLDFVNNQYYLGSTSYFIRVDSSIPETTISTLSGTGTEMVVADASGILSRQTIPIGAQNLQEVVNIGNTLTGTDPGDSFQTSANLTLNSYDIFMDSTEFIAINPYNLNIKSKNIEFAHINDDGSAYTTTHAYNYSTLNYLLSDGSLLSSFIGDGQFYCYYDFNINPLNITERDTNKALVSPSGFILEQKLQQSSYPYQYTSKTLITYIDEFARFVYDPLNPTSSFLTRLAFRDNSAYGIINHLYLPKDISGTLALSVNGNFADDEGNITISAGGGTVTSVGAGTGMSFTAITVSGNVAIDTAKVPYYSTTPSNGLLSYTSGTWGIDTSTYLTSAVTSVATAGLISGGTITGTGTITTSMATNKLVGRSTAGTGIMEEIIVGTGLSLSAGTLSNSSPFTTPLTTKGDIYVRNGSADTRLPVGLDTQILLADSTAATGLKWGTNTAATPLGYYGAWQDLVTQTAAADNVGYTMIFRTQDIVPNGISIVNNGSSLPTRITFANSGIYNIQFSSEFQSNSTAIETITIWLRKNGVDVAGSAGVLTTAVKKAGNVYTAIASWNYLLDIVGGEYYELVWSTTNHTDVTMQFYAAGSPPPSAASVILTVTQQSGIMAGTGISRGIYSISANTTAGSGANVDYVYLVSGTTTITLPTAVGNTNRYTIKRSGTGVVSIATTSSQTIDGSASPITINVQYVSIDLISNGTNWEII